jgi:hypothetical protein
MLTLRTGFLVTATDRSGMGYSVGITDEDAAKHHAAFWVGRGFEGVKITDRARGLEIQLGAERRD